MKRFSMIPLFLVVLAILFLSFQSTAFAASLQGSPGGKHVTTMAPNCVVTVRKSKVTPDCTPYPRCTASGCHNLDPYAENCTAASIYNQISITSSPIYQHYGMPEGTGKLWGHIYNYYSSGCDANWAVISLSVNEKESIGISTSDSNGQYEQACYPDCENTLGSGVYPAWTNMVDGTNLTVAFALVPANGGGYENAEQ